MLVCIDKITCARMYQRIIPLWQAKLTAVQALIPQKEFELQSLSDEDLREEKAKELAWLRGQAAWMEETIVEIIISEAQNEVADLQEVGLRHHSAPCSDEARLRDGRQSGGCRDGVQEPGASVSRRHRAAPCG